MTLKMYRMEDTERVRMKLREDRRKEVRDKFDREEELEKMREERMMKNKKLKKRQKKCPFDWCSQELRRPGSYRS